MKGLLFFASAALATAAPSASAQHARPFSQGAPVAVPQYSFAAPVRIAPPAEPAQKTVAVAAQLPLLYLDAGLTHRKPPAPWTLQDSAVADYTRAVNLMNDERYRDAAEAFEKIPRKYPGSQYAANAYYWSAFARYRLGGPSNLRNAVMRLNDQRKLYPQAAASADAIILATRINGVLAATYRDDNAHNALIESLYSSRECSRTGAEVKVSALSALQIYDPSAALRYLRQIFAGSRDCSVYLREQAVFVLAQIHTAEATDELYGLALAAKDLEVRVEAVHWLSDIHDDRSISLFRNLVRSPTPMQLKEAAMFALTRQATRADAQIFRDLASSRSLASKLRVQAVLWLAEQRLNDQSNWLLELYGRESSQSVRQAVVRAIAAQRNVADKGWLLSVGRDSTASIEARRTAITAAAELTATSAELYQLYRDVQPAPLRELIIEILGGHQDKLAVERLIDIATAENAAALRVTSLKLLRESKDPRAVAFVTAYREKNQ